jgi:hypothetical protein
MGTIRILFTDPACLISMGFCGLMALGIFCGREGGGHFRL